MLCRDLSEVVDVHASDVSVFMQGKVSAEFSYHDVVGKSHTVYLHGYAESLTESISDTLAQTSVINRVHLNRVLQSSLEMGMS